MVGHEMKYLISYHFETADVEVGAYLGNVSYKTFWQAWATYTSKNDLTTTSVKCYAMCMKLIGGLCNCIG